MVSRAAVCLIKLHEGVAKDKKIYLYDLWEKNRVS
jgi:hypothetical protein